MLLYNITHLICFKNSRTCHNLTIFISSKRIILNHFNIITLTFIIRFIGIEKTSEQAHILHTSPLLENATHNES